MALSSMCVGDSLWNKNLEVVEAIWLRNRSVGLEATLCGVPWLTESVHIISNDPHINPAQYTLTLFLWLKAGKFLELGLEPRLSEPRSELFQSWKMYMKLRPVLLSCLLDILMCEILGNNNFKTYFADFQPLIRNLTLLWLYLLTILTICWYTRHTLS